MGPSATICYMPCFLILNMLTVDKLNTRVTYSEPIMTAPLSGHVTSTITFMQRPTDIYSTLISRLQKPMECSLIAELGKHESGTPLVLPGQCQRTNTSLSVSDNCRYLAQ